MSADLEMAEEARACEQDRHSPRPVGDVIMEDDLNLWEKRKKQIEEEKSDE